MKKLYETNEPLSYGGNRLFPPFIRYAGWHRFNRYTEIAEHRLPHWEIGLLDMGRMQLVLDGARREISAGHFIIAAPGSVLAMPQGSNIGSVNWIMVQQDIKTEEFLAQWMPYWDRLQSALLKHSGQIMCLSPVIQKASRHLFDVLTGECCRLAEQGACLSWIAALLEVLECGAEEETERFALLNNVLEMIRQEPCRKYKIAELATICNMSSSAFYMVFKQVTGVTPGHYINQIRIDYSIKLMQNGSFSNVSAIADRLGFSSPAYFCVVFRQFTGKTPTQYLAKSRRG